MYGSSSYRLWTLTVVGLLSVGQLITLQDFMNFSGFIETRKLMRRQESILIPSIDVLQGNTSSLSDVVILELTMYSNASSDKKDDTLIKSFIQPYQIIESIEEPPSSDCTEQRDPLLDYIKITPSRRDYPKILCFIMANKKMHFNKVKAVRRTWGKRCDKLIISSDKENPKIGSIKVDVRATWDNLWPKLIGTVHHIWEHYSNDYDWFLKADTDSYIIMENLKEFLASEQQIRDFTNESLVYGRRIMNPLHLGNLINDQFWFGNPQNERIGELLMEQYGKNSQLIYNHGGAGYVMNRKFLSDFVEALNSTESVHGKIPEDMAISFLMKSKGIFPQRTRDKKGRERFHPEDPNFMFWRPPSWYDEVHQPLGGISRGLHCCSRKSISFHHVKDLYKLEDQLYRCRDLDKNNTK